MKDNSIIIVLKDGIQIREPIETNNYIYKSGKVVGLLSSLSETHCLLLANLLKLIKMLCSYFVQQRHEKALAIASAFSTKSADGGRNPPLVDEIASR